MGDSFDNIGDYVRHLSLGRASTLYVTTESQAHKIFFNDCNQERINKYWKEPAMKDTRTESTSLYMPLPSNFKENISDFSRLFTLANILTNK